MVACTTRVYSKPAPEPPSSYFPPSNGGSLSSGNYGPPSLPDRYGPPQQQPIVHKHVYVHVPPPEAPEYKPPKYIPPAAPPQKHYKIVFIKAPTPPTPTAPALPPLPPQDEEKTLIYVLVKKPEEAPEVVLPTQAPTQPSKPEVYFIRYKTQVNCAITRRVNVTLTIFIHFICNKIALFFFFLSLFSSTRFRIHLYNFIICFDTRLLDEITSIVTLQKESQNVEYGPPAQPPSDNYGAPPSSPGGPY